MYKFLDYSNNKIHTFETKQELIDYLDNLCVNRNLVKRSLGDDYFINFTNGVKYKAGDECYDGICQSNIDNSTNQGARILGLWRKTDCK